MAQTREDNETAAPEPLSAPVDGGEAFIVSMEQASVFSDLPAAPADAVPAEAAPLLDRAFLFLEDGDWAKADEYCERALDLAPYTSLAYLGKFMAEHRVRTREDLTYVPIDAENDRNYSKAIRFADPDTAEVLTRCALTGRSAKKQKAIRRAVTAVLVTLACAAILGGTAAAVWFGRILPRRTFEAELAALQSAVIGDTVTFGSYKNRQEWLVLGKEDDRLLLLSRRAVGTGRYSAAGTDTAWANSDLRAWLNGEYYEKAFGRAEKELIRTAGPDMGADGDRLFLPDLAELNLRLKTEGEKRCLAPADGKKTGDETPEEYIGWWLRTQTDEGMPACYIDGTGATRYDYYGEDPELGIRPAVWVDLNSR